MPNAILGLVGDTASETSVAGVTVKVVDPDMLPEVAVMVAVPAATGEARPLKPAALLTVAIPLLLDVQFTAELRFCVEPSEKVPVATNCWVVPNAILGLVGVTASETSVAAVTVKVVDPDMLPETAVMVVEPAANEVANPDAFNVAAAVLEELHVAVAVKSCVVLSENVPVARNCWLVPFAMLGLVGEIAIDTSVAGVTVRVVDPVTLPDDAVIIVLPTALPLACPGLYIVDVSCVDVPEETAVASTTVAMFVSDEAQVTEAVRSFVVLSE